MSTSDGRPAQVHEDLYRDLRTREHFNFVLRPPREKIYQLLCWIVAHRICIVHTYTGLICEQYLCRPYYNRYYNIPIYIYMHLLQYVIYLFDGITYYYYHYFDDDYNIIFHRFKLLIFFIYF